MSVTRNYGLDFLKFVCAFMVVCLHASIPAPMYAIIIPVARIAVPIFFMITGYFYQIAKENEKEKRQMIKIAKLLVGANVFYLFYGLFYKLVIGGGTIGEFLSSKFSLASLVEFVLFNESPFKGHVWYLGAILYVLVIIYLFEKRWDRKKLYPLVPFLLLLNSAFGKYSLLIFGREFPYFLIRNFLFVGLPYFLIGDILYKKKPKINNYFLILFTVVFVLHIYSGTLFAGCIERKCNRRPLYQYDLSCCF